MDHVSALAASLDFGPAAMAAHSPIRASGEPMATKCHGPKFKEIFTIAPAAEHFELAYFSGAWGGVAKS
jgi:hypothetical protein